MLAQRIKTLRNLNNLTQKQLAKKANIPSSSIANIESRIANPTIKTLNSIAKALSISIEELFHQNQTKFNKTKANQIKTINKKNAQVIKAIPDKLSGLELEIVEIDINGLLKGSSHSKGCREYCYLLKGQLKLYFSGEQAELSQGDVLSFDGHQAHSYKNTGNKKCQFLSVLYYK